jgi:hypothetical protein
MNKIGPYFYLQIKKLNIYKDIFVSSFDELLSNMSYYLTCNGIYGYWAEDVSYIKEVDITEYFRQYEHYY